MSKNSAEVLALTLDAIYACAADKDRWEDLVENFPELDAHIQDEVNPHIEVAVKQHFQRAEGLARRLNTVDMAETPNGPPVAYLVMDRDQKLLASSPKAVEMLAPFCAPLEIGRRLTMLDEENLSRFRQARQALRGGAGATPILLHCEDDEATQSLSGFLVEGAQLARLLGRDAKTSQWEGASAFIMPDRTALVRHDHVLRESLGLTPAELRLASLLKDGVSVNEAANRLGIAVNTARNQLRAIFTKLGVNRQSEMVRHLAELGQLAAFVQSGDGAKPDVKGAMTTPGDGATGERKFIVLADGRHLAYREFGRYGGTPVLFLHAVLSNSCVRAEEADAARRLGIHLVVPERPGTGWSTPDDNMSFESVGRDLVALVDHLGFEKIYVTGRSSGAPFALEAARQLGIRVPRLMLWAARFAADKDRARKDLLGRFYAAMMRAPWYAEAVLALLQAKLSRRFVHDMLLRSHERSPPDHDMLRQDPAMLDFMVAQALEALETTHDGVTREAELLHNDMPIDLEGVSADLVVWHGRDDGFVSVADVQRRFSNLPLSEFRIVPDEGHIFSLSRRLEVLERLIS
ncbi:MAG: alpha/beta fold hydrolase [Rhizobiales bacterium]|nr:alpha/beta fold hydrolase [Hyphomicrobiales bacterium]